MGSGQTLTYHHPVSENIVTQIKSKDMSFDWFSDGLLKTV